MIVRAMIEDPKGATLRHRWDAATQCWTTAQHPHALSPWPANYGYIEGTLNPHDHDALDVLVLASASIPTGTTLDIRPVGVHRRPDGDHKVLAVSVADACYGSLIELAQVPLADLKAIEHWFLEWTSFDGWEEAQVARRLIVSSRKGV